MSITVREILKMKEWSSCTVIAGEKGLDREVFYIDSMEVPDIIPWLKEKELLITTAYAVKDSEETLLGIIRALAENHSSGIALKTIFFGEITEKIKQTANELEVPMIEIPKDTPAIDLTNPLMKKIVSVQNRKLEFNKAMNEKFLAVQIEGGSFEGIAKILGELMECQILVTDNRQNVICCFPEDLPSKQEWLISENAGEITASERLQSCAPTRKEGIAVHTEEQQEIWTQGVYVKARCSGYLYVIGNPGQFNEMSEIAVRQGAVYLALEFSKKGLMEQKEYHQDNSFFLDLIGGNILSEEDALRRAGGLHWPAFPYYMVVSDIDGFEEIVRRKSEEEIQDIKDEIVQIHKDILKKWKYRCFIGNKSDSFHCLFTRQADRQEIKSCMEEIQEQINKTMGIVITVGISREIQRYSDFSKAYKETRTVITIGKKYNNKKICFIEELRMEQALFEMSKMDVLRQFVSETLQILEDYDSRHGSCLVDTLRVLTKNLGARKETAEELYLHRNTLTYRIRQIEQLTGYDLNDPEVLFRLQLALKVKTYMEP